MTIYKYLIISATISRYGYVGKPSVALRDREPKLKGNEISLKLALDLPDALFKRPQLEAKMVVPAEAAAKIKITPEITDNIEKIIKETIGLTMAVSVVPQEEKKKDDQT